MTEQQISQELVDTFNLIKENASNGKIVYETENGMFALDIKDFANKDIEEMMQLLGLDMDSILSRSMTDASRFVNDFAIVNLLCHYRFGEGAN